MTTRRRAPLGRYLRFYNLQAAAAFVSIDGERLDVPKGHQILHMVAHMLLYGPVDLARLNWWEARHVQFVKDPVKRTRQHEKTFLTEMHAPVNRLEVGYAAAGYERGTHARETCLQHRSAHEKARFTRQPMNIYKLACKTRTAQAGL